MVMSLKKDQGGSVPKSLHIPQVNDFFITMRAFRSAGNTGGAIQSEATKGEVASSVSLQGTTALAAG